MSTVGAIVYNTKVLLLTDLPDGATNGKKGYARVSLSDGTRGSVTGTFSTAVGSLNSINVGSQYKATFTVDTAQFPSTNANSVSTPVVGLLTYPAVNWMVIIAALALVYYLYYHRK